MSQESIIFKDLLLIVINVLEFELHRDLLGVSWNKVQVCARVGDSTEPERYGQNSKEDDRVYDQ